MLARVDGRARRGRRAIRQRRDRNGSILTTSRPADRIGLAADPMREAGPAASSGGHHEQSSDSRSMRQRESFLADNRAIRSGLGSDGWRRLAIGSALAVASRDGPCAASGRQPSRSPSGSARRFPPASPEVHVDRLGRDEGEVDRPASDRQVVADEPPAESDPLDGVRRRSPDDRPQPVGGPRMPSGYAGQDRSGGIGSMPPYCTRPVTVRSADDRRRPGPAGAEPGDPRPPAPAPTLDDGAARGDRAPRRDAGAAAAEPVPRPVVAARGVRPEDARRPHGGPVGGAGPGHALDDPPGERRRLPDPARPRPAGPRARAGASPRLRAEASRRGRRRGRRVRPRRCSRSRTRWRSSGLPSRPASPSTTRPR